MGHEQHTAAVFAPVLHLTVTVELKSTGEDEIHVHPGGQGFWIARMLKHLGERPLLCGPLGGEAGQVFKGLLGQWGMDLSTVDVARGSPIVIHDRRSGDRDTLAQSPSIDLARHEIDDIYGKFFDRALASSLGVVTGQNEQIFPTSFYRRLGHDLNAGGIRVVADLHGPELEEFLDGGPIEILKVSDEDLETDGLLPSRDADRGVCEVVIDKLVAMGARNVVLSRQDKPALARFGHAQFEAAAPGLEPADHRGAGDSMTAGLTAALRQGLEPEATLRLACAAGAANVTRHGLGSAEADLIPGLVEKVEVKRLSQATP